MGQSHTIYLIDKQYTQYLQTVKKKTDTNNIKKKRDF